MPAAPGPNTLNEWTLFFGAISNTLQNVVALVKPKTTEFANAIIEYGSIDSNGIVTYDSQSVAPDNVYKICVQYAAYLTYGIASKPPTVAPDTLNEWQYCFNGISNAMKNVPNIMTASETATFKTAIIEYGSIDSNGNVIYNSLDIAPATVYNSMCYIYRTINLYECRRIAERISI